MLNFYIKLSTPYPMISIITSIYNIKNIMITITITIIITNKSNQLGPKIIPYYYNLI